MHNMVKIRKDFMTLRFIYKKVTTISLIKTENLQFFSAAMN